MYKTIVKSKVRKTFESLSKGQHNALIDQLASGFTYEFIGDHAIGGTRTSKKAMEEWFNRLDQIFSELRFTPRSIVVQGMPWATTVLAEVEINGSVAGEDYKNILFQRVNLSMGKITEIRTLEDNQLLVQACEKAAANGVAEAAAQPING